VFGIDPTMENLLTLIDARVNPRIIKEKAGAFVPEIGDLAKWRALTPRLADGEVSKAIRSYVFRQCFICDSGQIDKAQQFFVKLLNGIRTYFQLKGELPGRYRKFPKIPIFTTNFDNGFEQFCRREVVGYCDGYDHTAWGGMRFNHVSYGDESYQTSFKLYKLHGTVRYVRNADGNLDEITRLPADGSITANGRPASPDLVYAGSYQYTSNSPQLELLYLMKEKLMLTNRIIVVGYSFNDPHILTVFRDVLSARDTKLVICSPHSNRIISSKFREYRGNCIPIRIDAEHLNPLTNCRRSGVPR
jgi:hypothetical protein